MGSFRQRGKTWRAELYKDGVRESATFPTKQQAVAWAKQRELELVGKRFPNKSVKDALRRYALEVAPKHRGERWEAARLRAMERDPLAKVTLLGLRRMHIAEWRERRLKEVSNGTVRREMNLLQSVFKVCRREWEWMDNDPLKDVARPASPPPRRRRISADEVERMVCALGYDGGPPQCATEEVALAFLLALETAMRTSEILGLTWADVGEKSVTLPKTKNGDVRRVPLSMRAREIIALMPKGGETVFQVDPATKDVLWRRARDAAEIPDLHFHDSRAEAIWRLSKKLDVMELARMIGHRDIRSLMFYYNADPDELADRL